MTRRGVLLLALALAAAVAALPPAALAQRRPPQPSGAGLPAARVPPLPDPTGWGTHVLAMARGPDGTLWVGTYGQGIYVLRPGATVWENLRADTTGRAISWDFVHAFGFGRGGEVWYGTVGNGWGVSSDGGRTWRSWQFRQLGPRWQYVAPNGIVTRGDTVFIGTADGIRWTSDRGTTWHEIVDTGQVALPSRYVLALASGIRTGGLFVSTLRGVGTWSAGRVLPLNPAPVPVLGPRVRTIFVIGARDAVAPAVLGGEQCAGSMRPRRRQVQARWECMSLFLRGAAAGAAVRDMGGCDGVLCAMATSAGAVYGARLGLALQPPGGTARSRDVYAVIAPEEARSGDTLFGTACGLLGSQSAACLQPGDTIGMRAPAAPLHNWFARPIARTDQPFIDQTYRYGSTMGGNFQQHQGVEFNNPSGTSVLAIDAGRVVHAGPAERGALTVAIRHDSLLTTPQGRFYVYSAYYHNSRLLVAVGERVTRGQPIARVGSTGRATNDHLHLEVHATPLDSARLVVDAAVRFPPHTTNPELWIEPLPGTGMIAGQVFDAAGRPVPQARVYGIVKPQPQETPFSFAEAYGELAHPSPAYAEHFAVSDVPAGEYVLGVEIEGRRVFRRVRVEAGKLTWVEFRP